MRKRVETDTQRHSALTAILRSTCITSCDPAMAVRRLCGWQKTPPWAHREAVVSPTLPLAQSALLVGWDGGTTALLDVATRSLVQAGNGGTPLLPLVGNPDLGSPRSGDAWDVAHSATARLFLAAYRAWPRCLR